MGSKTESGRQGPPAGRDLTTGPIGRTLIIFALPVMGANVLQSLSGAANAAWVSHALGEAALTAISNANMINFLLIGASFGISMSANLMIAQAIGAGDQALARRIVGTSTVFFLALSLGMGTAGWLLTPRIMDWIGVPLDARADAVTYLRVIFIAMPSIYFFAFLMMAQRATGDSRTPFLFMLLAVAMDVLLNPVLIMGLGPAPRLGIAGSGISTLTTQTLGLAAMAFYLYRSGSVLVLRPADWPLLRPDLAIVKTLVLKGLPMAMQMAVMSGAGVVMISLVNSYGSTTAAAYGAANQLWTYIQMPSMAIGAAVSSMAAQNVGAGRMDRVDRIAWVGSLCAFAMSAVPVVLFFFLQPIILRLFLPADSPSMAIAIHINHFVLWGFIPFGVAFVLAGIIRSTGSVWPPLLGMIISLWLVRLPFAKLLMPVVGSDAIWWSFPLGATTMCLLGAAYVRWGSWRKAKLLETLTPETPSAPNRPGSEAPAE